MLTTHVRFSCVAVTRASGMWEDTTVYVRLHPDHAGGVDNLVDALQGAAFCHSKYGFVLARSPQDVPRVAARLGSNQALAPFNVSRVTDDTATAAFARAGAQHVDAV